MSLATDSFNFVEGLISSAIKAGATPKALGQITAAASRTFLHHGQHDDSDGTPNLAKTKQRGTRPGTHHASEPPGIFQTCSDGPPVASTAADFEASSLSCGSLGSGASATSIHERMCLVEAKLEALPSEWRQDLMAQKLGAQAEIKNIGGKWMLFPWMCLGW